MLSLLVVVLSVAFVIVAAIVVLSAFVVRLAFCFDGIVVLPVLVIVALGGPVPFLLTDSPVLLALSVAFGLGSFLCFMLFSLDVKHSGSA